MSIKVSEKKEKVTEKYDEEWLKSFEGFKNYSEEESIQTIKELQMLANVVCVHFMNIK